MSDEKSIIPIVPVVFVLEDKINKIEKKLSESEVLNGGFQKILFKIDYLVDKEDNIEKKWAKLDELLLTPPDGLFYQVKDTQNNINHVNLTLKSHLKKDEELQEKLVETTQKTQENMQSLLNWKKAISRGFWAILVPVLGILGKVILMDLLNIHPGHH